MSLAAKHVIIMVVVTFVIMAALALLLAIFLLAFYAQRGVAPASPAPTEARHSSRASPMIGQSPYKCGAIRAKACLWPALSG
jgi:hypothetical protein